MQQVKRMIQLGDATPGLETPTPVCLPIGRQSTTPFETATRRRVRPFRPKLSRPRRCGRVGHQAEGSPKLLRRRVSGMGIRFIGPKQVSGSRIFCLEHVPAKENPPRKVAASFPGPDLLHAFGSVGHSALTPSDAASARPARTGALGVVFWVEDSPG